MCRGYIPIHWTTYSASLPFSACLLKAQKCSTLKYERRLFGDHSGSQRVGEREQSSGTRRRASARLVGASKSPFSFFLFVTILR